MDSSLVPLVSIGKVSMDYGFIRAIIIGIKKMPVEIVVVGLQGMFQDEWLMIRPPLEPPPRMMYETWIRLLCQFILLTFVLIHGQSIMFCFYSFFCCKTLALGLGVERFTVIAVSFNFPKLGLASYIALSKVINSESRPRADDYMWSFHVLVPLLNTILMI
ncbi:unnamed protein product [Cuscuta epithymum]|uniref:Uncharacterized protein n=1 Tax=Cuscuta epithymum TaxID=186058 RepID=A0AAV0BXD8_9ASTE|nr:unnamed protein product [Cuscuta epithymum]